MTQDPKAAAVVASELEAKLLVEREADLDSLARLTRLGSFRLRPRPLQKLHSVYLDSKDFALVRCGVALRVRRDGDTWEATVKWAGSVRDTIHQRPELNLPLDGPPATPFALPAALHVHLAALLAGRKVAPVLITEIERLPIDVLNAAADQCLAEIALDRVFLHAAGKRDRRGERYCEVEVERKDGTAEDVASVTALLRRGRRLRPAQDSKLSRGLRLLYGSTPFTPPAAGGLTFDDSLDAAARKVVARNRERLLRCDPGTRLGLDPEALHDMRVATRRLRAFLRALDAAFPARLHGELTRSLRWLGALLGAVRDVDVQQQRLAAYRSKSGSAAALEPYAQHLSRKREDAREAMLAGLDSPRYSRLLRQLESFAISAPAEDTSPPLADVAAKVIRKTHRQLRKRGDKIGRHPSAGDLHQVRIRSKRLRYICEFLAALTGRPGRRLVKRMVELQDLLGSHNDAVVASELAREFLHDSETSLPEPTCRALVSFIGKSEDHAARARSDFHRTWKHFTRRQTERELDAMLDLLG